jgi:hypothetical protein
VYNSKHELCLLTNRHVVDINYQKKTPKYKDYKLADILIHMKVRDSSSGLPSDEHCVRILNYRDFMYSSEIENDVACLRNIRVIEINGREAMVYYRIGFNMIADNSRLNEKLIICDFVAFPGFPEWYDRRNNHPILRTGTIASDPRFDYSYDDSYHGEVIAYEAFSYGGSSGSPVFAIQKGFQTDGSLSGGFYREIMLVGINAGHIPIKGVIETHSGISYFYKSSVILELIER